MTKIEQFLINYGLAQYKYYPISNAAIYRFKDELGFYGRAEVHLYFGQTFELHISPLYDLTLVAGYIDNPKWNETFIENHLECARDHLKWALKFRDELSLIENPWEEVDA